MFVTIAASIGNAKRNVPMRIRNGDTAIVTGASRGLGVIVAKALAQRGTRLVIAARSDEALNEVAATLRGYGVEVLAVRADMESPASIAELAAAAEARFGQVDILVNNAGIESTLRYDLRSGEEVRQMIAINLAGPMELTRLVLPGMIARSRGHIVNIASVAGLMPSAYEEPYTATKYGLVGFTKSLRLTSHDCNWNVGASAICPGFMAGTGMFEDMKGQFGVTAPASMGVRSAEELGPAVIRAIEKNLPDVVLMKGAPRVVAGLATMMPRVFERIVRVVDTGSAFRKIANERGRLHGETIRVSGK
jgi:short-subunit dehydrogenase